MASANTFLRLTALAVCALLAVAAAVAFGSRMQTSTQVNPPPLLQPTAAPAQKEAFLSPVANPASSPRLSPTATSPAAASSDADRAELRARALTLPVQGVLAAQLADTYTQARAAGASHEALDIMAAHGTPVLAVEDGPVAKLFLSKPGGVTIYQFDPGEQYAYYYAHLDRYADGVREGTYLHKGQVIAYVGSTGNASPEAPHLHFAIFRLGPERQWWRGTPLNPFLVWRDSRP